MAIIKKDEYQRLTAVQIKERLTELRKELMRLNAQISMGTPPENPGRVKAIKKTVAKLLTKAAQLKQHKEVLPKQ